MIYTSNTKVSQLIWNVINQQHRRSSLFLYCITLTQHWGLTQLVKLFFLLTPSWDKAQHFSWCVGVHRDSMQIQLVIAFTLPAGLGMVTTLFQYMPWSLEPKCFKTCITWLTLCDNGLTWRATCVESSKTRLLLKNYIQHCFTNLLLNVFSICYRELTH